MSPRRRRRFEPIGLRREVAILLPTSLVLLVVLSAYTLWAYQASLRALADEERQRASRLASQLAVQLSLPGSGLEIGLDGPAAGALGAALLRPDGSTASLLGDLAGGPLTPLSGELPTRATAVGPNATVGDRLVAYAPLRRHGETLLVRLDLPAASLAAEQRRLARLAPLVLAVDFGLLVLLLLFLRHAFSPFERLLDRVQTVEGVPRQDRDEVALLVETFEKALAALARESAQGDPSDLAASRRREVSQRLAQGLAQLGEMAAGVAHELRNSIATLSGYLSLIERSRERESVEDYLTEIRHEVAHLSRVVSDFLAFARPGTARAERVDLGALARRIAADPALGDATITVAAPGVEVELEGDSQLLERALKNLVANAVEADRRAGGSGRADLGVRTTEAGVELTVADRGPGVPAAIRERLFQPFVSGRPDGVGLGLALAWRVIQLHGGTLALEDRPGGGTVATAAFPIGVSE
ncbi:MAG TPA: ATP-binding protein [Thermoanaerobaculia bacterium]|nr:ATP-binding protein [Thermoanaerobaculia bacterium]